MAKQFKPKYVKNILISKEKIEKSISNAAKWLDKKFSKAVKAPLFLGILRGCIPFYGRLIMQLNFDITLDFMNISSFRGAMTRETDPEILSSIRDQINGRDVVIVEDIIDSGKTISILVKVLKNYKPKSVKVICLIDKPDGRQTNFKVDYACNTIKGTPFLIGYGLDIKEKARNLPYIAEFKKSFFNKI